MTQIAGEILAEQSPKRLLQVRGRLYELIVNCIPAEVILKKLVKELMRKLDAELKHEVARWAAHFEHRLQEGQKPIIHLEVGPHTGAAPFSPQPAMTVCQPDLISRSGQPAPSILGDFGRVGSFFWVILRIRRGLFWVQGCF